MSYNDNLESERFGAATGGGEQSASDRFGAGTGSQIERDTGDRFGAGTERGGMDASDSYGDSRVGGTSGGLGKDDTMGSGGRTGGYERAAADASGGTSGGLGASDNVANPSETGGADSNHDGEFGMGSGRTGTQEEGGFGPPDENETNTSSGKSDSTAGRLMEKAGGIFKSDKLQERGEEKRRQAGGSDY